MDLHPRITNDWTVRQRRNPQNGARFVEDVGDRTRVIVSQTTRNDYTPGAIYTSAGPQEPNYVEDALLQQHPPSALHHTRYSRHHGHSHGGHQGHRRIKVISDFDSDESSSTRSPVEIEVKSKEKLRPRSKRRPDQFSDDFSDDFDINPTVGAIPSLTFHFEFSKEELRINQPNHSVSNPIPQNRRQENKDNRLKLFQEKAHSVLNSRYTGGIHGREDATAELVTQNTTETIEGSSPEIFRWMYVWYSQIVGLSY